MQAYRCNPCGAVPAPVRCGDCEGQGGVVLGGEWEPCPACNGEGSMLECPVGPHGRPVEAEITDIVDGEPAAPAPAPDVAACRCGGDPESPCHVVRPFSALGAPPGEIDVADIRERHRALTRDEAAGKIWAEYGFDQHWCAVCTQRSPCDAARLADTLDRERAARDAYWAAPATVPRNVAVNAASGGGRLSVADVPTRHTAAPTGDSRPEMTQTTPGADGGPVGGDTAGGEGR